MKDRKTIEDLRRTMGTLPDQDPELITEFFRGCEGITASLIDIPVNPYKTIYTISTSTWGKQIDKWDHTSPEGRFMVVKAALTGNTLPTALESVKFTFAIEGVSRSSFDQTARQRIGAGFGARGTRDNNHRDAAFRIPEELWDDKELIEDLKKFFLHSKDVYDKILSRGNKSWQSARCVMPMGMVYGFSMTINLLALMGFCSRRMKFCEQEDTVATAWMLREAVKQEFPFLAEQFRPGCDRSGTCQYHKAYSLSELFGCLFKECGRNKCLDSNDYAEFNQSCTDEKTLAQQLGIVIPGPKDWIDYTWDNLPDEDRAIFENRVGTCQVNAHPSVNLDSLFDK